MNLLINEPPLQVLPSLAKKVGLNEAIIMQQMHFRLQISQNVRDGHKWIYNSYADWHKEFPFFSEKTIKRVIRRLEDDGYIISTDKYNKLKMDKTKWYRLDYLKLGYSTTGQNGSSIGSNCPYGEGQTDPTEGDNLTPPIPKDIKSIKNNNVGQADIACEIINYLNAKANKQYKSTTTATKRLINGRLAEGYSIEDFKRVIDLKVQQWLHNPDMNKYLRPDTLFNATKFEAYLNEGPAAKTPETLQQRPQLQPPVLDFRAGED